MADLRPVDWQEFFDSHAPHYLENEFTKWTSSEVTFLLDLFPLAVGSSVLDIGCGVGRHSLEFARRGYQATGVDLSSGMLAQAKAAAEKESLDVEWIHADACAWVRENSFDLVLCLCEGGLGLASPGSDPIAHDLSLLRTAFQSAKPGAGFVLTAMNGYSTIRRMTDQHVQQGVFDPATMVSQYVDTLNLTEGSRDFAIRERLLIPSEMVAMLRHVGFEVQHVWGGTAGEWGKRSLKLDEIEMMVVSQKP